MQLYGGIDLHSNNCVINLIDENDNVIIKKKIRNNIELMIRTLKPHYDDIVGLVVESTYNWYWLVDGLMEAGFKVHLANTTAIQQYSGLKYADDDSDANWLARMLKLNILPTGFIYPKEQRMQRDLLRKRMQLVQEKTKHLLSIQGLYDRHINIRLNNQEIKTLTHEKVNLDFKDTNTQLTIQSNLAILQCLAKQVKTIEKSLLSQLKLDKRYAKITSIDGIGVVLALTIILETGKISRFNKVGDYASYCRLVSGARYSNGKKKAKVNTKNGNKYLCWAFIEAANFAIRYNETIKKYYQRKLAKTNPIIAKKTVAHKLARSCFYVLRDDLEFDVDKAFGYSK